MGASSACRCRSVRHEKEAVLVHPHSYIVRKRDVNAFFDWARQQDFFGRWMPETHALYEVFLGEFFWSPAYAHFNVPYYHRDGWTRGTTNVFPDVSLDR